jgi:molybdopterin/thiamine biosynthesis adenylyltransferase
VWWERYPGLLQVELDNLDAHGIRYEVDDESQSRGVVHLRLFPAVGGRELPLIAIFPDSYPFFRFEVQAPTLQLRHHQHAQGKNLCLLPRRTEAWGPNSDYLGDLISERLPLVLESGERSDPGPLLEAQQAEPYSDYYLYYPGAMVLVDSAWSIPPEIRSGALEIGVPEPPVGQHPGKLLNGAVLSIHDESDNLIANAPPEISTRFPYVLRGRWTRAETPFPADLSNDEIFRRADESDSRRDRLKTQSVYEGGARIRGILYPEEVRWSGLAGGALGDAWLFAIQLWPSVYAKVRGRRAQGRTSPRTYLARPGRAGRDDMLARIPELAPLSKCKVAVFGLGCIGAPGALELARAGVGTLRILDGDLVDPATVVRWPLGLSASGQLKANVLASFIRAQYPHTTVVPFIWRIGATRDPNQTVESEQQIISEMLDNADLIYDATAEFGVHYFLSEEARQRGITYVGAHSTPGGWGGMVWRIRQGTRAGCWSCLQRARPHFVHDSSRGSVQPVGCADPTFTGANFDVQEVAMMGVRLVASTLCSRQPGMYPAFEWDYATVSLRDEDGRAHVPRWEQHSLARDPECPVCATSVCA